MNILALDFATRKTGYAVYKNKVLADNGLLKSNSDNIHERILQIREKIIKIIKDQKIQMIILEEVPMMSSKGMKTAHDLCVGQGMVLGLCGEFNLGLRVYEPTKWRGIIGTYDGTAQGKKRDFQKNRAVELVNELYNLNFKYYPTDTKTRESDDDIAEAILIGLAFLKELGKNE